MTTALLYLFNLVHVAWISVEQILIGILIYSIPSIIVSLPLLYLALGHRKIWFTVAVFVWIFILPFLLVFSLNLIFDGIVDRAEQFSLTQRIIFFWIPFYAVPPLLAALLWMKKKQWERQK